jgi:hypothetical protein
MDLFGRKQRQQDRVREDGRHSVGAASRPLGDKTHQPPARTAPALISGPARCLPCGRNPASGTPYGHRQTLPLTDQSVT